MLERILTAPPPVLALLGAAAVIFIVAFVAAARALRPHRSSILDRLVPATRQSPVAVSRAASGRGGVGEAVARGLQPIGRLATPKGTAAVHLRKLLVQAGLRQDFVIQVFVAAKVILAALLPAVFLFANHTFQLDYKYPVLAALILGVAGFLLPNLWLYLRVGNRKRTIEHSLPDAVDLLVTCLEAGLGLDAAISRVADEITLSSILLAEELKMTFLEAQAGMPRVEAFRRLADRTGVDELRSLAATLTQTEIFGTSIANALRIQADWIRTRRMQKAEERAATVAVKMTVPLVLCILPSLLAVIVGPAAVRIATNLMGKLGG